MLARSVECATFHQSFQLEFHLKLRQKIMSFVIRMTGFRTTGPSVPEHHHHLSGASSDSPEAFLTQISSDLTEIQQL